MDQQNLAAGRDRGGQGKGRGDVEHDDERAEQRGGAEREAVQHRVTAAGAAQDQLERAAQLRGDGNAVIGLPDRVFQFVRIRSPLLR